MNLNVREDKNQAFKRKELDTEMQGTEGTTITYKFRQPVRKQANNEIVQADRKQKPVCVIQAAQNRHAN